MSRSIRMELPSSAEEGWTRHQEKCCEATFDGADGVVLVHKMYLVYQHHPVCAAKVASRLFINRAATPPQLRRGVPSDASRHLLKSRLILNSLTSGGCGDEKGVGAVKTGEK